MSVNITKLIPGRRYHIVWQARSLGYGDESGAGNYLYTGEIDTWGKATFVPARGEPVYLFEDEIVRASPARSLKSAVGGGRSSRRDVSLFQRIRGAFSAPKSGPAAFDYGRPGETVEEWRSRLRAEEWDYHLKTGKYLWRARWGKHPGKGAARKWGGKQGPVGWYRTREEALAAAKKEGEGARVLRVFTLTKSPNGRDPASSRRRRDDGTSPGRLTAAQRAAIPNKLYALPARRALPIEDPKHVRNAASRLEQMHARGTVTEAEYRRARARIAEAAAGMGIDYRPLTSGFRDQRSAVGGRRSSRKRFTAEQARLAARALGWRLSTKRYGVRELVRGMNVELEHGTRGWRTNVTCDDPIQTARIALAHLEERPDYYARLAEAERAPRRGTRR